MLFSRKCEPLDYTAQNKAAQTVSPGRPQSLALRVRV